MKHHCCDANKPKLTLRKNVYKNGRKVEPEILKIALIGEKWNTGTGRTERIDDNVPSSGENEEKNVEDQVITWSERHHRSIDECHTLELVNFMHNLLVKVSCVTFNPFHRRSFVG